MEFRQIASENFDAVCRLQNPASGRFVATNERSLAQAWLFRKNSEVFPYAIYEGETPVGFIMLRKIFKERRLLLWRLMIDEKYMHRGLGTAAVRKVIDDVRASGDFDRITLFCEAENAGALRLYERLGFHWDGAMDEEDRILMLDLNDTGGNR